MYIASLKQNSSSHRVFSTNLTSWPCLYKQFLLSNLKFNEKIKGLTFSVFSEKVGYNFIWRYLSNSGSSSSRMYVNKIVGHYRLVCCNSIRIPICAAFLRFKRIIQNVEFIQKINDSSSKVFILLRLLVVQLGNSTL